MSNFAILFSESCCPGFSYKLPNSSRNSWVKIQGTLRLSKIRSQARFPLVVLIAGPNRILADRKTCKPPKPSFIYIYNNATDTIHFWTHGWSWFQELIFKPCQKTLIKVGLEAFMVWAQTLNPHCYKLLIFVLCSQAFPPFMFLHIHFLYHTSKHEQNYLNIWDVTEWGNASK